MINKNLYSSIAFTAALGSLAGTLVACSDDPVNYSEPVGIKLKFKSGDVVGGRITTDKNINTESGNPYASFVSTAKTKIGGNPSRIEIPKVTLQLENTSKMVATLGQVFVGDCAINFALNSNNLRLNVGNRNMVAADLSGPIEISSNFDSTSLSAADYDQLLAGSFKVALDCPAAATFAGANAEVDLTLLFTFSAFE